MSKGNDRRGQNRKGEKEDNRREVKRMEEKRREEKRVMRIEKSRRKNKGQNCWISSYRKVKRSKEKSDNYSSQWIIYMRSLYW